MKWTNGCASASYFLPYVEQKLWEGEDQALARYLSEKITEHRDLLAPMLSFLVSVSFRFRFGYTVATLLNLSFVSWLIIYDNIILIVLTPRRLVFFVIL